MSTRRRMPGTFEAGPTKLGPNGRALCRWCESTVPKGRRTFCSDDCVREWNVRTSPSYARQLVAQRDKGVCASCGLDTVALAEAGRKAWRRGKLDEWRASLPQGYPRYIFPQDPLWQADHIVPVVEGGGECGLDNYRTLCTPCHNRETAALAARRAQARRRENLRRALERAGIDPDTAQLTLDAAS